MSVDGKAKSQGIWGGMFRSQTGGVVSDRNGSPVVHSLKPIRGMGNIEMESIVRNRARKILDFQL